MSRRGDWRSRLAGDAALVALVALICALVVWLSGGVRWYMGPLRISSRDPDRFFIGAAVFYAASLMLGRPGNRSAAWSWVLARIERVASVIAIGAAAAVLGVGLSYGAHAAGGADAFGYVSQAYLWLKGDVQIEQPLALQVSWPFAIETLSPLGYQAGATPNTTVPTYSAGVPMIMSGFYRVFGACGPFYVQPAFAALLVLFTFGLAHRLTGDRLTSLLAAVLMACSPALLFNMVLPMSDTVTAALWIAVLLVLTWPRVTHAVLAGCIAAVAILARPNLVPLVLAGCVAAEVWGRRENSARRGARALAFLIAVTPAIIAVAILNARLYGSPLASGYGRASDLYTLSVVPANLWRYASWLVQSQSVAVFLALVPLLVRPARPLWLTARVVVPASAFVVILSVSYLIYFQFDVWWYLRFLLGAFPILFILMASALAWLTRLAPPAVALPGLVLVVAMIAWHCVRFLLATPGLEAWSGEARYVAVAQYVRQQLPSNAIVIGMQHSGTMAFYSGRTTLRYDFLPRQRLPSVIDWLTANGFRPYIVLDEWEEPEFKRRFAGQSDAISRLDVPVIAETTWAITVRVYDPAAAPGSRPLQTQIHRPVGRECAEPHGVWSRGSPDR
jgi:hypothetical protein